MPEYHPLLDQLDSHLSLVEQGVHLTRLENLAEAKGIKAPKQTIQSIADRLDIDTASLSEADLDAFIDLVVDEISTNGDGG